MARKRISFDPADDSIVDAIKEKTPFQFIIPEDANYSDPHVSGDGRYFSFTEES